MKTFHPTLPLGPILFLFGCGGGGSDRPVTMMDDPIGPIPQVEMQIQGTVLDADTGTPVPGATVRLADINGCVPIRDIDTRSRTGLFSPRFASTPDPIGPVCPASFPVNSDGTYELSGAVPDPDGNRTCSLGRRLTAAAPGYTSVAMGFPELQCTENLQTIDFLLERSSAIL